MGMILIFFCFQKMQSINNALSIMTSQIAHINKCLIHNVYVT